MHWLTLLRRVLWFLVLVLGGERRRQERFEAFLEGLAADQEAEWQRQRDERRTAAYERAKESWLRMRGLEHLERKAGEDRFEAFLEGHAAAEVAEWLRRRRADRCGAHDLYCREANRRAATGRTRSRERRDAGARRSSSRSSSSSSGDGSDGSEPPPPPGFAGLTAG